MTKFLIRNDDVAFDTDIAEIKHFCEICDKYDYQVMHAIMPIGEYRKVKSKMTNEQLKVVSSRLFGENEAVLDYLRQRKDLIAVHGLWHTHAPSDKEIHTGKSILLGLGLNPTYFVPPFNEGEYEKQVVGLKTCKLSAQLGERLEDFLGKGTPNAPIMYLHSWRFDNNWYTFDQLEYCLKRLKEASLS